MSSFLAELGVSHADIIKHCNGTLKLGIKFNGFNQEGSAFTFPFGVGQDNRYNSTMLDKIMAHGNVPDDILSYPDISTHCRITDTLTYLERVAGNFPNLTIQRRTVSADDVAGTYDMLIDCTGFAQAVVTRDNNFMSIQDRIPNNRALVFRHEYTDRSRQLKPYSVFHAAESGWIWNIPLGDQLAVGYVHWDKFDVMSEFIAHIHDTFGIDVAPDQIGSVSMRTGRNIVHMQDNQVTIGLSSAFIEPLESTGLYLVTNQLDELCQYIDGRITENDYNDHINESFDRITNFILAHYVYSKRSGEYWDFYKNLHVDRFLPTDIFPHEAWEYILSGFDDTVCRPNHPIDPRELIALHRGKPYTEWLDHAKHSS